MSDDKHEGLNGAVAYKAFGLTVFSTLRCPELLPGAGGPDVAVVYGDVPRDLPGAKEGGVRYQAAPGRLLLEVDGVARFLVRGGNEIIIDRCPTATDDDVRLFLLGSAFGALLHQRGILALHGSTVKVGDGCVVFLGRSGTGKSTLAAELARRGYPCLGDDVCAVSVGDDGVAHAAPAYPQVKLWIDSLQHLGIDPAGLRRIRPSREKRALSLQGNFCTHPVPVRRLYVLSRPTAHAANLSLKPMMGPGRIRVLREYTYRVEFLQGLGLTARHFKQIAHLSSRLPMTRAFFSRRPFVIGKLASLVEDDFHS